MNLKRSGIYTITSPSGNLYVGSAVNIKTRWEIHRRQLRSGKHHNYALKQAFNKYGLTSLKFDVLFFCHHADLLMFEQRAIDCLRPEYNSSKVAGSTLGLKFSDEARRKLSEIRKGKSKGPRTPEHCANLSRAQIGIKRRPHSEEHKRIVSEKLTGRKHSAEARANMTAAQYRRGPPSEETKQKISAALAGRKLSPETIAKRTATCRAKREAREAKLLADGHYLL